MSRRVASCPLAGGPVHAPRNATARRRQPLDRDLNVIHRSRVELCHVVYRVRLERAEDEQRVRARCRRERRILGRRHHEHGQPGQSVDEFAQGGARLHAGTVDVVEHKQRRAPASRTPSRLVRAVSGGPAPAT